MAVRGTDRRRGAADAGGLVLFDTDSAHLSGIVRALPLGDGTDRALLRSSMVAATRAARLLLGFGGGAVAGVTGVGRIGPVFLAVLVLALVALALALRPGATKPQPTR